MNEDATESLDAYYRARPEGEMRQRAHNFAALMGRRRTVREFSSQAVPKSIISDCIKTAATAPNGANKQPWHFVAVSDAKKKQQIRTAAEQEEREFYENRASEQWLDDLAPLGTDHRKPFLGHAPWLIAIFAERYELSEAGEKKTNYYVKESVGIATGLLIAAIHNAGLVSLTHTPSPMGFLNDILARPKNEKPFLLLVVGYPAEDATVPKISKKPFSNIATFV